jgi:hypothetical protein
MAHSVSAISAEKATADPSAMPSSEKRRPVEPSRNTIGTKTAMSTAVVARTAKATCCVPRRAASSGRFSFVDAALHVLEHDDGVVDDEADGEHQGQEREQVHGRAEQPRAGSWQPSRQTGTVTAGMTAARKSPRKQVDDRRIQGSR